MHFYLRQARIDHKSDTLYRNRSLCHISRNYHFSSIERRRLKYFHLLNEGHSTVACLAEHGLLLEGVHRAILIIFQSSFKPLYEVIDLLLTC